MQCDTEALECTETAVSVRGNCMTYFFPVLPIPTIMLCDAPQHLGGRIR